ncbi:MAG: ChaN family lipoprotein [Betaproteobacteria bacterium]
MRKHYRSLILGIIIIGMIAIPPIPRRCFASSGSPTMGEIMEKELSGRDWTLRKKAMLDYGTYVSTTSEISLRELREGNDAVARAIGQGKSALVLHLLRRVVGEEAFSHVARNLSEGPPWKQTWDDIRALFEKETGKDLGWFFQQWVDRKGLPDLRAEHAAARRSGSAFEVSFDLIQKGDIYTLDVPVFISFTLGGGKAEVVKVDAEKKHVTLLVDDEPSTVVIDREYDIPRRLTEAETPPLLAKVFSEEKPLLVLPVDGAGIYAGVIDQWKKRGAEVRTVASIKDEEIKKTSVVVLGKDNPLLSRLYGKVEVGDGELSLVARGNPWNLDNVVVIVEAKNVRAADESMHTLVESGDCSSLTIDAGGRIVQKTGESEKGIEMELREEPLSVDVSTLKSLTQVIESASEKKIVYVGESHDRFAHHAVELQVIKGLSKKNPKIAIGMEMFQRPFQRVLDDYISGTIEEREFLKKSEYFSRWSFDYNLYKPILDFARAEKIPVVALNLQREIVDKVSRGGIDALTDDERKNIPSQTDFSNIDYRDRLKRVFAEHQGSGERNFDFFYQAQILWDETMAFSIDEYLKKNPDRQMIVIAGGGHLAYGSGIPKRAFRRNGYTYSTILNDAAVDQDIADYLVFPQTLDGVMSPKLMVVLREGGGKVIIVDLPEDSVSRKAGIKAGDTIVSLDGAPVQTLDDVKIALFYKKHEDTVIVKAVRKRFLLGEKEMQFDVKFR